MEKINEMKATAAAVLGALSAVLGWFGWLWVIYVAVMALDYATGTAAASRAGQWRSAVARDGLWRKFGSLVAVLVALGADGVLGLIVNHLPAVELPWDYSVLISPVVLVWYIVTELGSIAENAAALGAPIPRFLRRMLDLFADAIDDAGDRIVGEESHRPEEPASKP